MNYFSVCDGIGAAHVALLPLGYRCVGVSEIDKYCNKLFMAVPVIRWIGKRILEQEGRDYAIERIGGQT